MKFSALTLAFLLMHFSVAHAADEALRCSEFDASEKTYLYKRGILQSFSHSFPPVCHIGFGEERPAHCINPQGFISLEIGDNGEKGTFTIITTTSKLPVQLEVGKQYEFCYSKASIPEIKQTVSSIKFPETFREIED